MSQTLPPYLTGEELDDLCKPLTQRYAQMRRVCRMLGISDSQVERRPDGMPIFGRKLVEEKINGKQNAATGGIKWSK